jgi:cytochrome c oxidase assembly factor CtaG
MVVPTPVKVAVLLFLLGTASSAAGLLCVAATFKAAAHSAVLTVLCILLAVAFVFVALARQNSELMKTLLWLLAVFEAIVAVASPLVPFRFHGDAG